MFSSRLDGEELPEIRIEAASPAGPRVTFNIQDSVSMVLNHEWAILIESELLVFDVAWSHIKVIKKKKFMLNIIQENDPCRPQLF